MAIELYKHNEIAYEKTKEVFKEKDRCAIIHPTGSGKSYIALKWIFDNKDKKSIYVTSHLAIKDQLERTIRGLEEDFPNMQIITYSSLLHNNDMKTDLIVLDEFHRAGAPEWGQAVDAFLNSNKNAKVLGLTATPVRYLDGKRDMSDEIFEGNVASHITLPKAIAERILPPPTYINAIYSFKEEIEKLEEKISKITDKERQKELEEELKLAKRTIENAENIEDIFKKYMTKANGKYLVFCRDINHLEEMKDEANNWFKQINKNIETHYMHSLEDEDHNKYTLDRFHYVKNDNLKLLYSVGMLNEGVHVNDIDGVIMLRPTSSPILYQQQLGRALTTGKKHEPLVFDVVNNIECLKDIELLRDTVIKIMEKSNKPKKEIQRMEETFKIIDDYKNISILIKELDINATYGWNEKYELLKQYVENHNGMFPPMSEPIIGNWLDRQKQLYKKRELSKERKDKLNELGDWLTSYRSQKEDEQWDKKYELLKEYVENHNGKLPQSREPIIGNWLIWQKEKYKKGELSKEKKEKLDKLGDWLTSYRNQKEDEQWDKKCELLKEYVENHNGQFPPYREPKIGYWLSNQKQAYKNEGLSKERKEKLDKLGDWLTSYRNQKEDEQWDQKYELLKEYVESHNEKFPVEQEPEIGTWFIHQKQLYKNKELSERRKIKLDALGDWLKGKHGEQWSEKYELLKQYIESHNGQFPLHQEPKIGSWLSNQKQAYKNEGLSKERKEKLDELGNWLISCEAIKNEEEWDEKYRLLKQYVEDHHGKFPPQNGQRLGKWLSRQKQLCKNEKLSDRRKAKLDALGNWTVTNRKKVSNVKNLKGESNVKKSK